MQIKYQWLNVALVLLLASCSVNKQIARLAKENVLDAKALQTAHIGISIFEPATNNYWFNYQGDKYFVPASNTKIPTCYAAMKYLGDSLVGLRYGIPRELGYSKLIVIDATGDPTFLFKEYTQQPVLRFLQEKVQEGRKLGWFVKNNNIDRWGSGWSWNDYESDYMAERSSLPIFGNVVDVKLLDSAARVIPATDYPWKSKYRLFKTGVVFFDSLLNNLRPPIGRELAMASNPKITISRQIGNNTFSIHKAAAAFKSATIPFVSFDASTAITILSDTLKSRFAFAEKMEGSVEYNWLDDEGDITLFHIDKWNAIHSQPTDSLLKPMMHRSDNFFAEQSLLMVSNEMLGVMNDDKIIDTLLKTDFKDLPQKPRWVDGSGLSRYNLFTPQDFVFILNKMRKDFGMERIKTIFATGGNGTIANYYKSDSTFIYGKTGTLSGVVAFSGFLYTKKGKLLIFSTIVNNHQASATEVRRSIEKFLQGIRREY